MLKSQEKKSTIFPKSTDFYKKNSIYFRSDSGCSSRQFVYSFACLGKATNQLL